MESEAIWFSISLAMAKVANEFGPTAESSRSLAKGDWCIYCDEQAALVIAPIVVCCIESSNCNIRCHQIAIVSPFPVAKKNTKKKILPCLSNIIFESSSSVSQYLYTYNGLGAINSSSVVLKARACRIPSRSINWCCGGGSPHINH